MISAFGDRLGQQLADQWASTVVAPGGVFAALSGVGLVLHQKHAIGVARVADQAHAFAARYGNGAVMLVLLAGGFFTAAMVASTVAQTFGKAVLWIWTGDAPRSVAWPLWIMTCRRWKRAHRHYESEFKAVREQRGEPVDTSDPTLRAAERRRDRISIYRPTCATWTGNRFAAMEVNIRKTQGVDPAEAWRTLWITLPDNVRNDIMAARRAYEGAAVMTAWGVMFGLLGALWWPAVVVGVAYLVRGWASGHVAAGAYASLVEAAFEVYRPALGSGNTAPVTP